MRGSHKIIENDIVYIVYVEVGCSFIRRNKLSKHVPIYSSAQRLFSF